MYVLEIFFKKSRYTAIFDGAWKLIGNNLSVAQHVAEGADPQLELYYFISVFYGTVYQAAISAEMSTSAAHYLARIQTGKSKVEKPIVQAAQEIFAVPDNEKLIEFGTILNHRIGGIVTAVANSAVDEDEVKASMEELYRYFQHCGLSAENLLGNKG